jgi:hypothetical protein
MCGHTDPTLTMRVYQLVIHIGQGGVETLEDVIGCTLDGLFRTFELGPKTASSLTSLPGLGAQLRGGSLPLFEPARVALRPERSRLAHMQRRRPQSLGRGPHAAAPELEAGVSPAPSQATACRPERASTLGCWGRPLVEGEQQFLGPRVGRCFGSSAAVR